MTHDAARLTVKQLHNFFDLEPAEEDTLRAAAPQAMQRTLHCVAGVDNKYFRDPDGNPRFTPLHSGQWLLWLCYLANTLSRRGHKTLADKVYYLNKIMHGVDIYHEVDIPAVFFLEHPLGTVLGRARYSDGFMAYQGCTVGGNRGHYPVLGRNVRLMSNSKVLGNSHLGDNVTLAANTYVKDRDIPAGCTVFGRDPNLTIKHPRTP